MKYHILFLNHRKWSICMLLMDLINILYTKLYLGYSSFNPSDQKTVRMCRHWSTAAEDTLHLLFSNVMLDLLIFMISIRFWLIQIWEVNNSLLIQISDIWKLTWKIFDRMRKILFFFVFYTHVQHSFYLIRIFSRFGRRCSDFARRLYDYRFQLQYNPCDHVVTSGFLILSSKQLRDLYSKSSKHRDSVLYSWHQNLNHIMEVCAEYADGGRRKMKSKSTLFPSGSSRSPTFCKVEFDDFQNQSDNQTQFHLCAWDCQRTFPYPWVLSLSPLTKHLTTLHFFCKRHYVSV